MITEKKIKELPIKIGDGNYSSKYPKSSEFLKSGIPFISASDIKNGRIVPGGFKFISKEQHNVLRKGHLLENDVLIVSRGNGVGQVSLVDKQFQGCNINAQLVLLRVDEKLIHSKYLYYLLCSKEYFNLIKEFCSGSAQPQLTITNINEITLKLPQYNIQVKIAEILSSLDDKIELNKKINQELESLAQLLFKRWFVYFEFSNENGEPYKSSGGQMVDSELGEIPKGWEAIKLGDIVNHQTLKVKKIQETITNVYSAIKTSELVLSDEYFNKQVYSKSIENYYVVEPYCFAYNPSRINIGSIGLNKGKTGAVSPVYVVFNVKNNSHYILEYYFKLSNIKNQIIQKCSGTVRQSLNFDSLSTFPFVKSPDNIINKFNEYIEMYYNVSKRLTKENDSLIKLREELLPKLISGELQIKEN